MPLPLPDPGMKGWAELAAWLAAAFGFLLTAFRLPAAIRDNRRQRAQELRWRQAEAGKKLNDEMQSDRLAWAAMQMLDTETERQFSMPEGTTLHVRPEDVARALDPATPDDPTVLFLRDAFDTWFYFMAMMHHYVSSGLIHVDDVAYPMDYYIPLLSKHHALVSSYLRRYDLTKVQSFLEGHKRWAPTTTADTRLS